MYVYSIQCMYIQSNVCILLYQIYSISELSRELSLIVTVTDKEPCAALSAVINCHLSRPIGSKISYLLGYYSTSTAVRYSVA